MRRELFFATLSFQLKKRNGWEIRGMKGRWSNKGFSRLWNSGCALMIGAQILAGNVLTAAAEEPEETPVSEQQETGSEEKSTAEPQEAGPAEEAATEPQQAGTEEETIVEPQETEPEEEDAQEEAESETDALSGYIGMPEEYDVPGLESDLDYDTLRGMLVDGQGSEEPLLMTAPETDSLPAAFPCKYTQSWLEYMTKHYPVTRNQGSYGSCWAHTSVALAEFNLINQKKAAADIDLSELHLSYWAYTKGTASEAAGDTGDNVTFQTGGRSILNNGGSMGIAAQTLMRQRGYAKEATAPYYTKADDVANGEALDASTERQDVAYLQNAYLINIRDDVDLVKEAIRTNGAVGASIYESYSYYNAETNAYYECTHTEKQINHAITIVGWDDDFPRDSFKTCNGKLPEKNGAWLVRNSWSAKAEASYQSYHWLSYEDTSILGAWVFEAGTDFPYDNHYYYDSTVHNAAFYRGMRGANIYTVDGPAQASEEKLAAVSFEVAAVGEEPSKYTVQIYRDLSGNTPNSGVLVEEATTTGTIAFKGQYTIPLAAPVLLNKGEKFAVVVWFDDKSYALEQERSISDYGSVNVTVASAKGQSFRSSNGTSWTDMGTEGNLVISALTKNAGVIPKPVPTLEEYVEGVVFEDDPQHIVKAETDANGNLRMVRVYSNGGTSIDKNVDSLLRNIRLKGKDGKTYIYTLVFTDGIWDTTYDSGTRGAYTYKGESYFVAGGVVNQNANGLIYTGDKEGWKFLAAGRVVTDHAGLVMYADKWFWIDGAGSCDQEYAAIVKWNGADFLVHGGRLRTDYTGFTYDPQDSDTWYHITNGQVWGDGEITDISIEGGEITRNVVGGVVQE